MYDTHAFKLHRSIRYYYITKTLIKIWYTYNALGTPDVNTKLNNYVVVDLYYWRIVYLVFNDGETKIFIIITALKKKH